MYYGFQEEGMNIVGYVSNSIDPTGLSTLKDGADFAMVFAVSGSLELRGPAGVVTVNQGSILVVHAANIFFPLPARTSGRTNEYCIVLFSVDGADAELVEELTEAGVQTLKPGLGFTKDQLERRLRSGSPAEHRSAELYLLSFIYDFSDSGAVKSSSAVMDRHLGNAITYMKNHLREAVTLDRLSAAINISKTHLIRIFRKELGTSPMRYLTSLRVEESAGMLSGTDMTLGQVAEQLNFYSDSHFSKVFKKNMGENPSAYRHTYIDTMLSKQNRSFEELEKAYHFIQQLIDATGDLIFYKNVEGRYLGCNAAFCHFAALSREDIIGKTDFEIFEASMAKGFTLNDKMVLEEKRAHSNEEWIQYKDGTRFLVEVSKAPFFGLRGEIGGIIGISRDITYRRLAEERLLVAKEEAVEGRKENSEESLSAFRALSRMVSRSADYLSLLKMSENNSEKMFMIMNAIRESESLVRLLDAFVGIKETEIGEFALEEALFSVKEIFSDSSEFADARFPQLEAVFESAKDFPILLKGCSGALLKVLKSLISHIGSSAASRVDFLFEYADDKLSISATDNGPRLLGNRTSTFKFEETEALSENRSWDINLRLCQDVVEYLSGEWNIANTDSGVVFTAVIPMSRGVI